jgi:hypothetical protein
MDFIEWMKLSGLSEKSANSYQGAIKGRLTNWARTHGLTTKPIVEIPNLSEFAALSEKLRQTPEFLDRNKTGNGMYAAALSSYQKYLQAVAALPEWAAPTAGSKNRVHVQRTVRSEKPGRRARKSVARNRAAAGPTKV